MTSLIALFESHKKSASVSGKKMN